MLRTVYAAAACLSMAAAALVVASRFIADRAPQSTEFLGISLVVGFIFMGIGVLLLGIGRHVTAVARLSRDRRFADHHLATHVNRLMALLLAAGAIVTGVLALLTYAILARIDQGFAVFG